jgi:enoyl-CoA hydratase/carnithine racemase
MTTAGNEELPVLYEVKGDVGWITLNRAPVLNALNSELVASLAEVVETAAGDPNVMLVVVRGAGRAFSSGMDRTALAGGTIAESFFRSWARALNRLEDMPKISVAVLHGYSIGGGLQLALACDIRIATDDAIVELGATRHGLVPDGAVLRLARVVGLGRAKQLALLNDRVTAAQAHAMGLVNYVGPQSEIEAMLGEVIEKTRGCSPTATAETKRLLNLSFENDPRLLGDEVIRSQNVCLRSWEIAEANRAWSNRRKPRFYGRGES